MKALLIIGLIILAIVLAVAANIYVTKLVKRFGWAVPNDCFLVVVNPREFQDTTLCYYVKTVTKIYDDAVEFEGCLIDMNNPTDSSNNNKSFTKLRIPRAWIISRKTKIKCFDPATLKSYIELIKTQNDNG